MTVNTEAKKQKTKNIIIAVVAIFVGLKFMALILGGGYDVSDLDGTWMVDCEQTFDFLMAQERNPEEITADKRALALNVMRQQPIFQMQFVFDDETVTARTAETVYAPLPKRFTEIGSTDTALHIKTEEGKHMYLEFLSDDEVIFKNNISEKGFILRRL